MSDPTKRLLNGRLDTLVLKTLEEGPRHGYGIAWWLEAPTDERIQVDESSLYPALHRLHEQGLGRRRPVRASAESRDFADTVGAVLFVART